MPMAKDPHGGGTEADGSHSAMYCGYCYANGEFTWKDATAARMREFCKRKLREQGYSRLSAWFYTSMIPRLKRWNP